MRNANFRGRRVAAAALAATAVLTVTAPSAFADSTPAAAATAKPPASDGAKGVCKRESKAEKHVDRALNRLDWGATTVGSVARMQQRADNAKKEGHTAIATLLDHKLTYRKGLVTTLQQRQRDLKDVAAWCSSHNGGK
ncbi:hypothetical protein [Streptomyces xanthochromogenes]|uniref:Secreted protein n=1 Tax=Streptomyces xanthochromogenes TaxID=67384 RepID=A0ABQ3ANP8_9ACTN|nr:hypothetical protein [Streptomyces xanthochromogenes]GGY59805.1 hypothetical protein GCM10010326_63120 [Streptomyces xanthochromogenes]